MPERLLSNGVRHCRPINKHARNSFFSTQGVHGIEGPTLWRVWLQSPSSSVWPKFNCWAWNIRHPSGTMFRKCFGPGNGGKNKFALAKGNANGQLLTSFPRLSRHRKKPNLSSIAPWSLQPPLTAKHSVITVKSLTNNPEPKVLTISVAYFGQYMPLTRTYLFC